MLEPLFLTKNRKKTSFGSSIYAGTAIERKQKRFGGLWGKIATEF